MELFQEMLIRILQNTVIQVSFPDLNHNINELVEGRCYQALQKIQAVLKDDRLDDTECFQKIEEIVCVFEDLGSGCGTRHDFG